MKRRQSPHPEIDAEAVETDAWAVFTNTELKAKLTALRKLVDGDMLSDRSTSNQRAEIALIEGELARRRNSD
ncbi:hypothetical protein HFP57_07600 [Parasphingopyxis algicola]|uniref:hypothetical protein n=1 Tax=Parasphingopyxis algicola TaxID=2026624 RepID=UPI0015A02868|nr:hypothetical protein [Parasphingopyxis algicola]QLC24906.1 hypothetical protein HFP57_07600 [Parasphingopyxis algicola]